MKIASIDIGTNTLLLLISEHSNGEIKIIKDYHKIARLGEGVDSTGLISENAINRAKSILQFYSSEINVHSPEAILAVATSAMRDAKNSKEVKNILGEILNTEIKIIDGEDEAKLSFLGSSENKKSVVIDIGGGSTEIIAGEKNNINIYKSFNIGAVRLTERFNLKDKNYQSINNAEKFVKDNFNSIKISKDFTPIAVAGTPNTMAMIHLRLNEFSREALHRYQFKIEDLSEVKSLIISASSNDLINKYHVHPNRADIILGGAIILEQFLKVYNFDSIMVSCNGLRYGLAIDFFNKNSNNES